MSLFEDCFGLPKRHRDLSPYPIYEPLKYDPPQWPWPRTTFIPNTTERPFPFQKPDESTAYVVTAKVTITGGKRVPAMRADDV